MMSTHVKVLSVLFYVCGGFLAALAFFAPVVLGVIAGIVGHSNDPDAATAGTVLGITGIGLSIIFGVLAIPNLFAGWGLWNLRPWGRILAIVLGVLGLLEFPFGTLMGIYALVILFRKDTEALFVKPAA